MFTALKGIHIWNVTGDAAQESLKANNTEIFGNRDGHSGMFQLCGAECHG